MSLRYDDNRTVQTCDDEAKHKMLGCLARAHQETSKESRRHDLGRVQSNRNTARMVIRSRELVSDESVLIRGTRARAQTALQQSENAELSCTTSTFCPSQGSSTASTSPHAFGSLVLLQSNFARTHSRDIQFWNFVQLR